MLPRRRSAGDWGGAAGGDAKLAGSFDARATGVVEAWLRRDNTTVGNFDLDLYGSGGTPLAVVAGLGRSGDIHTGTAPSSPRE